MKEFFKVFKDKKNPVISILLCIVIFAGIIFGVVFSGAYEKKKASITQSVQIAELLAKCAEGDNLILSHRGADTTLLKTQEITLN